MSVKMRSTAAEKGVLKVVHPGRHVEILRDPITAGEVMARNPRHRVTRPDVFKFPWIVIKPESVLPLGKVFYLVPEPTLYALMKSEMNRNRLSSQREPSRKITGRILKQPRTEQRPTGKGDAGGNFDRGPSSSNWPRQSHCGRGGAVVVPLKSCLMKPESDRKSQIRQVRFRDQQTPVVSSH